ncbi:MAG: Ig-like domain-containing protein, partial [Clostridia bacterium]
SSSNTVGVNADLTIGNKDWVVGGKIGFSYSHTWGEVTGKNYSNGKTQSESAQSSSTLSVALPPYTAISMMQETGTGTMDIKFDFPIAVTYDVDILYFQDGSNSAAENNSFCVSYRGNSSHNSTDARSDLNQRANMGTVDQVVTTYGANTKTIATSIWKNVPLSLADTAMSYGLTYTTSDLNEIRPLLNLSRVELKDKATSMLLKTGEGLDVSTIALRGLNEANVPYFGFNPRKGSWVLLDENGGSTSGATPYLELKDDPITGKAMLTALKGGGTGYIKYIVSDKTYVDVMQTELGATGDKIQYIDLSKLQNEAVIRVTTTGDISGYTVVATGQATACVGDTINLAASNAPVSAMVVDGSGKQVIATIGWEVQELSAGISIAGNDLTCNTSGTFHIRATWNGLYSAWLEVVVRPARVLTKLALTDPNDVLADWHADGASKPYDLTTLPQRFVDQYGETMTASPVPQVKWYVAKDGGAATEITTPATYSVTEAGSYVFYVEAGGVRSNGLTMVVYKAAKLARIVIFDDPNNPKLSDYVLGSGSDSFQMAQLEMQAYDGAGNPYALLPNGVTWRVDGNNLGVPAVFTATKPGTYQIDCYDSSTGTGVVSNKLTLTVLPNKVMTKLIISDDPLTPLLKDYLLGSGSDTFALSKLLVAGQDQYGDPVAPGSLTWYVNGAPLSGSTLFVPKTGTYQIYASAKVGSGYIKSNALQLNVLTRVTGIRLNAHTVKLAAGDSFALIASAEPAGELDRYAFASAKASVASVTSGGVISAHVQGETTVTVTSASGYTATCLVTVVGAPESIAFRPNKRLMGVGDSEQLTPEILPAQASATLSYRSSDTGVVNVDANGMATARALGEAIISVSTHNGRRAECYIKVVKDPSVIHAPKQLNLGQGEVYPLGAQVLVKAARSRQLSILSYESMDERIASVDAQGVVTACLPGEATIVITSYNNLTALVKVQVSGAPTDITLKPREMDMTHGDTQALTYTLPAGCAGAVSFKSSKPGVASVDAFGTVTGLKKGKTTITATTYNGKKDTCTVVVVGKNPLTLKAIGAVDVYRPGSCVTLLPSLTDGWTGYKLTISAKIKKKDLGEVTDCFQVTRNAAGALEIGKKPNERVNPGATYTAELTVQIGGKDLVARKAFNVKAGKVKAVWTPGKVTLPAADSSAKAEAQVAFTDPTLAPIEKITFVGKKFRITDLGGGRVSVEFLNGNVPKKGETLKLKVFFKGSDKPVVVKLPVKIAK